MTARARYQRVLAFFWSEDSNAIYLLHLIEEYDACMSALSVALCPHFFCCEAQNRWADRPHSS